MTEERRIEDYLAEGGKLTSPVNVPARYRAELLRVMASFVDSEMAGAAGLSERINDAPSLRARVLAARIVAEKLEHAALVLDLMGEFGADTARYVNRHPWSARLARDADIGQSRHGSDMRLSVFHYPVESWVDAVVMSFLMGRATSIQLAEYSAMSYQPLAEVFAAIAEAESGHVAHAEKGLSLIANNPVEKVEAEAAITYWHPRVAETFGNTASSRFDALKIFGLRHETNIGMLERWRGEVGGTLKKLGFSN